MQGKEEVAPPGYMWIDVKSFDENGNPVFTRELRKMVMTGAPTEEREADDEIKKMVKELKAKVEEKRNTTFSTFEAVKYSTQVVNGIIYRIKVKVGDNEYIHIRVLKKLAAHGGEVVLREVLEGTFKLEDPIDKVMF